MNCSCIGFTSQLELATLVADEIIGMTVEQKVLKRNAVIFEASGGPDTGVDGFRKDTVPLCEALHGLVRWDGHAAPLLRCVCGVDECPR